jgi:hypothetical protein
MLCYKDRTYCATPGCKNACGRKLTEEIRMAASNAGMLLAMAYFCEDDGSCPDSSTVRASIYEAQAAGSKILAKLSGTMKNLGDR